MLRKLNVFILLFASLTLSASNPQGHDGHKGENHEAAHEEKFEPVKMIMEHISDAHDIHLWGHGHDAVSIPLPVVLWTENGLVSFMSSKFHHDNEGKEIVTVGNQKFVRSHNKIYYASEAKNAEGTYISEAKPLDFSITKSVVGIFITMLILFLVFTSVARSYKKNGGIPKRLTGWMEPLVVFVRDDIAKANIGEKKHKKFVPFLLTLFFFIWVLNLLGLTPLGFNVTGNIAVTLVLAVFTFLIVAINGNKEYWMHIFWPPVPHWLKPLMIPVEIIGIFTKPFALMIRLFANITAGHIVILSLISLIFIFKTVWISPASVALALFIFVLELLVAALQAYIFTLLTALFIGMATDDHGHEHETALNEI